MQEARFAGACQDQHAERKSIGATSREKAIEPRLQGLGPGSQGLGPRAWGRGLQKLRARAPRGMGPGHQSGLPKLSHCHKFLVVLKSLLEGGRRRGGPQARPAKPKRGVKKRQL